MQTRMAAVALMAEHRLRICRSKFLANRPRLLEIAPRLAWRRIRFCRLRAGDGEGCHHRLRGGAGGASCRDRIERRGGRRWVGWQRGKMVVGANRQCALATTKRAWWWHLFVLGYFGRRGMPWCTLLYVFALCTLGESNLVCISLSLTLLSCCVHVTCKRCTMVSCLTC